MDLGVEGGFSYQNKKYQKHPTKTIFASDYSKEVCDIYNMNFSSKCLHADIKNLKSEEISDHDILTGGFPCQSFSVVAQNPKRLGYKDDRGKLFFELCRILKNKKPSAFVAENVKGLISADKGETFPLIINEFESAGYHVVHKILNAADFGIPQKRQRVFIVGFRKKKHSKRFNFPTPITADSHVPLNSVLERKLEDKYFFSEKAVKGMLMTPNSRRMNKGRAQDPSGPCNTITSHLAKYSLNGTDPVLFDGQKYRMFTAREAARIQSFPETYQLSQSRAKNYRAIGNAVPPVLMWHLTKSIIDVLNS